MSTTLLQFVQPAFLIQPLIEFIQDYLPSLFGILTILVIPAVIGFYISKLISRFIKIEKDCGSLAVAFAEMNTRMNGLDDRMNRLENRMDRLEHRMDRIERRMDSLDEKVEAILTILTRKKSKRPPVPTPA